MSGIEKYLKNELHPTGEFVNIRILACIAKSKLFRRFYPEIRVKIFLDILEQPDPDTWHKHQVIWGKAILNQANSAKLRIWNDPDYIPSIKTVKQIINIAVRFMEYTKIHVKGFEQLLPLTPLTKSQLRAYEGDLEHKGVFQEEGYFMSEEHYDVILDTLKDKDFQNGYINGYDISPYFELCYRYGLRRAESISLTFNDIKRGYLNVDRQAIAFTDDELRTDKTKGRWKRKTPHWFGSPSGCYNLISKLGQENCQLIHKDTLSQKFRVAIKYLIRKGELERREYSLKDCRRTFITRALREHEPVDVQLASGHKDLRTTMNYQRDDRNLDDEVFVPIQEENVVPLKKAK